MAPDGAWGLDQDDSEVEDGACEEEDSDSEVVAEAEEQAESDDSEVEGVPGGPWPGHEADYPAGHSRSPAQVPGGLRAQLAYCIPQVPGSARPSPTCTRQCSQGGRSRNPR